MENQATNSTSRILLHLLQEGERQRQYYHRVKNGPVDKIALRCVVALKIVETFHGEIVARENTNYTGRRFFDLLEVDIAEKSLQFECAMTYTCQMMQRRISTTTKENTIVEGKVADVTSPDIGVGGEHIDTDEPAAQMRELVTIYDIATEKEEEKLSVNELQECPENLWRRVVETEAALITERVSHTETIKV